MRILALLALCGLTAVTPAYANLTQAPVTQELPRNLVEAQSRNWTHSLFFVERTITIPAGTFNAAGGLVVWETSNRHTSTNATQTEHGLGEYKYLFNPSEDIIIFDRRPNTPIWYGIAVGGTVIACFVFYLIVKKKRTTDVLTPGQYQ